jgi:glucose 1-dehydrogenase
MKLAGKVAAVTGGARGIGRASALAMAREGADVAILDRIEEEGRKTAAEIEALGRRGLLVAGDVSRRADDERFIRETVAKLGRLDVLLNNAAYSIRKPLLDLEVEDVEQTWAVTLWGVFHCTQLAARQMVRQGQGGSIISISSVHAVRPYALSTAYNGAKAAVSHMSRTWALEPAPHRIRVNTIEPGWIDTPGERQFLSEEKLQEEGSKLLMGRLGRAEEIAKAVVFLASEEDSSYVTGSAFRIDGGYVLPRVPMLREILEESGRKWREQGT